MSGAPASSRSRFVCLVLVLLTLLAYLPARHFGFLPFDDPEYIADNPVVQGGLTWSGVKWAFLSPHFQLWMPLTWVSHMLDCQLFGLDAGAQHMVNVLFHSLNAALAFLVLLRLTRAFWPSAVAAALFAWHPLRVESVAWVAERKDVLCAFFWMLSLWAWAGYVHALGTRPTESPSRSSAPGLGGSPRNVIGGLLQIALGSWRYWLALLFFALGLLSKPMLVTLPFVLLLLDYWPLRRAGWSGRRDWPKLVIEKAPFFLLTFVFCAVTVLASRGNALNAEQYPLGLRLANAGVSYARYLLKTFWPHHLAILYPLPSHWPAGQVAAAVIGVGLLSALAWRCRREHPHLLVGWLWFLGTLVPVLGLVQVGSQAMADRFSYLPSLGLLMALVFEASAWLARWPGPRPGALAGLAAGLPLVACLWATERQLVYWKSNVSLFSHAVAVTGDNAVARVNLGLALEQEGARKQARHQYQAALRLDPTLAQAHVNLGNVLDALGEPKQALAEYRQGVRLKPEAIVPRLDLGSLLVKLGDFPAAIREYEAAAQLAPLDPRPLYLKGKALLRQGRSADAVACFNAALKLAPDDLADLTWLARVLASDSNPEVRNGAEAVGLAERANALTGGTDPTVLDTLGMAYAEAGRFQEARQAAQSAVELAGTNRIAGGLTAMQQRLRLYEAGRPYREPAPSVSRGTQPPAHP